MLDKAVHPVLTNDLLSLVAETVCIDMTFKQDIFLVRQKNRGMKHVFYQRVVPMD